ncbi:hypothetical protein [Sporosarcina ureilytica]|uniref:Uncharacterized protein n=1 Tax=Sporosarcina ureilytica TaxID=298596 RepID=A0A1D8JEK0_9BACL|nr:hypothetical protein [Sporosarcina ureilytica]AOV07145.1 hypothetical protein BI350_06060 [Sporosarcina ureilytica]
MEGIIIVGMVMAIPITAILTDHKRRIARIQQDIVQEQIELEKIKQKNFIIETEKMKIELEQMKLEHHSEQKELPKP